MFLLVMINIHSQSTFLSFLLLLNLVVWKAKSYGKLLKGVDIYDVCTHTYVRTQADTHSYAYTYTYCLPTVAFI